MSTCDYCGAFAKVREIFAEKYLYLCEECCSNHEQRLCEARTDACDACKVIEGSMA